MNYFPQLIQSYQQPMINLSILSNLGELLNTTYILDMHTSTALIVGSKIV